MAEWGYSSLLLLVWCGFVLFCFVVVFSGMGGRGEWEYGNHLCVCVCVCCVCVLLLACLKKTRFCLLLFEFFA